MDTEPRGRTGILIPLSPERLDSLLAMTDDGESVQELARRILEDAIDAREAA